MKLEKFDFYTLLSESGKQLIQENLKPFEMKKDGIVYYAGEICKDFFLINSGQIKVYVQGEKEQTYTLYTVEDGKPCIINTFSAIFSNVTVANAVVLEDTTGWTLCKSILLKLLQTEPAYSAYLFSAVSKDIAVLVDTIEDVTFSSMKQRLENWIFSKETSIITVTHEEIANNLGSSRPIISKLLKDIEKEEKIVLKRGSIEIL